MTVKEIQKHLEAHRVNSIAGRYLPARNLMAIIEACIPAANIHKDYYSVEHRPIPEIKIGKGPFKILIWSQMHGNESTTTKALMDVIAIALNSKDSAIQAGFEDLTLCILPMLNPDGATAYTRNNANDVDLNRDAVNRSQPEMRALQQVFEDFQPDLCLNLHDQRTIFSAGETSNPASVSFLAPAYNAARDINTTRQSAMRLISDAYQVLSNIIPGQIGRYDDKYNLDCVGDYFTNRGVPTILFEAGHYKNDYTRESTRELIGIALLEVLLKGRPHLKHNKFNTFDYFKIPANKKHFYDIIIRDVFYNNEIADLAIQYDERLIDGKLFFTPQIIDNENLNSKVGHREYAGGKKHLNIKNTSNPYKVGRQIDDWLEKAFKH